jgi:tRNA-dihydrouridine synthase B
MASATALYYSGLDDAPAGSKQVPSVASKRASASRREVDATREANATLDLLKFNRRREKNYVVQLFGSHPEHFAAAARIITKKVKPDGIDINFGCPVPKIIRQGAGSGLMKDLKKSRAAIEAVLANTDLPVSIKIRAKAGEVEALKFLKHVSDLPIAAVMIHGRTLSQGFTGAPDWHLVKEARKYFSGVILANGGINNLADAQRALKESKADGLGLARGVLGRPWLFKEIKTDRAMALKQKQIFKIAVAHAALVEKLKGSGGLIELRKHLVWYVQGLAGAAKLRERLVQINKLSDIKKILK